MFLMRYMSVSQDKAAETRRRRRALQVLRFFKRR